MTITEKNKIATKVFRQLMSKLGQGRWTALPMEEAYKLPGDACNPTDWEPGSFSIGYFHKFYTKKVAEFREVFVAGRTSQEDPSYNLYTFKHHPGSFNPRDGGTPPETTEVALGCFGTLEQLLRRVIQVWVEDVVSGRYESAWEEEAYKQEEADYKEIEKNPPAEF